MEQEEIKNTSIDWQDILNKDGHLVFKDVPGTSAATASNYGVFFTALYPCEVLPNPAVSWQTAGVSPTLQIEKLTSTQALDSGVTLFQTAVDMSTTANTVAYPSLTTTFTSRRLVKGDRLALKDAGTLTNLVGVQVTLYISRLGRGQYAKL